jgi:hypothetical protein
MNVINIIEQNSIHTGINTNKGHEYGFSMTSNISPDAIAPSSPPGIFGFLMTTIGTTAANAVMTAARIKARWKLLFSASIGPTPLLLSRSV